MFGNSIVQRSAPTCVNDALRCPKNLLAKNVIIWRLATVLLQGDLNSADFVTAVQIIQV